MKNIWLKISGAAAAAVLCIILIQGGLAENLEYYQCGMEEHTHNSSCYEAVSTCGQDESEGHSHGSSCYDVSEEMACSAGDDEEHEHTDRCWKTRETLACGLKEAEGHTHTSGCEQESLICAYAEHTHSSNCIASEGPTEYEEPEESEEPVDTEVTMEEFLDNFTTGCYAFGSVFGEPGGRIVALRAGGMNETWNLENYVKSVVIKDKNDIPVTNGNFYYSFDYTFNITFAERTGVGGQFSYNVEGKLVYQLPEQIIVKKPVTNGVINGTAGKKIGDYTIDATGRVEVWFGNFDREGNAVTQNFIDYYSDTIIRLDIVAQFEQGTEQVSVDFGAGAAITVNLSPPPAGISVKKTASKFNRDTETIDYTIEVTPVDGKLTSIELTDEMLCVVPMESDFRIKNSDVGAGKYSSPFVNVKYSTNNGSTWTNAAFTASGDNWRISFPGVSLDPNGTVKSLKVQYTLDLVSLVNHFANQNWIERMKYDLQLDNTVTATGKDVEHPDQAGADTAKTQTPMVQTFLDKRGSVIDGKLQWTATAGNGVKRLNGLVLTDTLKSDQSIVSDITVKIWGKYNESNTYTATSDPDVTITLLKSNPAVNTGKNGGFTFNVPSGGWPGAENVYRIQFVYDAARDGGFPTGQYENIIATTVNGVAAKKNGLVIISPDATAFIGKESSYIYNSSGRPTGIEYTIRMEVGPGNQGKYTYINDYIYLGTVSIPTMPMPGIYNRPRDFKVTIEPHDPNFKYAVSPANLSTNNSEQFTVYLNADKAQEAIWPYNDQRTVTITYWMDLTSPGNIIGNKTGKSPMELLETGIDIINNKPTVPNNRTLPPGTLKYIEYSPSGGTTGVFDYLRIIEKSATANKDNPSVFDFKVELNKNRPIESRQFNGAYGYPLFEAGQPAVFEDTFDSKLEYVPGSLVVVKPPADNATTASQYGYYGPYDPVTKKDLVNISGNTIRVDFRNMCNITKWGGSAESSTGFTMPTGSDTAINKQDYKYWYAYYEKGAGINDIYPRAYKYIVQYQLRVKDAYAIYRGDGTPQKIVMKNTAKVFPTAPKYAGGKWESSTTVEYTPVRDVTKSMLVDGNIASVEISINPTGIRMRPLNILDPRFTAIDVMSENLAIYQGSVKIFTKGTDGKWKTQPETPQPDGLWGVNFISGHEAHFELMDEKAIKITYDALILEPASKTTSIDNRITVYGQTIVAGKDNFTVQQTSAMTSGSRSGLLLYKRDQDTGVRLPGAEFEVYLAMKNNSAYDGSQTKSIDAKGRKFFYVHTVNDASKTSTGIYKFDHAWIRRAPEQKDNGVYFIRETRAPSKDYICPDPNDPANYTYFVLDPNDKAYWEGILGEAVHVISDNIHLTNESNLSGVAIAGEKRLTGQTSATSATFGFELTQVSSDGSPYVGENVVLTEPLYTFLTMTPDEQAEAFAFDNIHGLEEGEYYFMAEEVDAPVGWTPMTAPQIIRVTVFGDEVVVEYPESPESADKIIFINKYRDPSTPFADALLPIDKRINAEDFNASKVFTFNIEQMVKDTVNGTYEPGASYGYNIPDESKMITITGDGKSLFVLENLPAPKFETAGTVWTYYFRVSEADGSATDSEWRYDPVKHIVRAEVTFDKDRGGLAKLALLGDDSWVAFETLTFTNTYAPGGPKLPDTGGIGLLPFIIVGLLATVMIYRYRTTTLTGCTYKK